MGGSVSLLITRVLGAAHSNCPYPLPKERAISQGLRLCTLFLAAQRK